MPTPVKNCYVCRRNFPRTTRHFSRNKTRKDGFDNRCKECVSKASKRWLVGKQEIVNARLRAYRKTHKENGQCEVCCDPPLPSSTLCARHFLSAKAKSHLGSRKHWEVLQRIWESQYGRCAYSGIALELGSTASIDHKDSLHKRADLRHKAANLQWVSKEVNRVKHVMSEGEFARFIAMIYAHMKCRKLL
jgi:hypothetical protein